MKTTADCKQFLVDFFKATPGLITGIYNPEEGQQALKDALVIENWKREHKCTPQSESSYINEYDQEKYEVWQKGYDYYRGPSYYQGKPMNPDNIICERGFWLLADKYDSAIMFLVLEDKHGQLYLGNYIGD